MNHLARALAALMALAALANVTAATTPGADAAPPRSPGAAASVPRAGSLVFVRDHDVWVARGDGSSPRRVTSDGTYAKPYRSPTQAANGTIVASHGSVIVRMRPSGRVLNLLDPHPLKDSAGHDMDGTPTNVAVSPDGSLVAYTFSAYSCPPAASCDTRFATAYTRADRLTDPAAHGTTYGDAPSWIGNHRTVQGGGSFSEVNLHELGGAPQRWFRDSDINSPATDLSDPDVSPDGTYVAAVRGYDEATQIIWYAVSGDVRSGAAPGVPTPLCETSKERGITSPTWSATSDRLAWTESTGVWLKESPADCSAQPRLVIPGATEPSFSAATWSNPAPENLTRPRVTGTAKAGRRLTVLVGSWTPKPSSYLYQWRRNGRPVLGAHGASYRLTKKDRGALVSVLVTARGTGGTTTAASAGARVRR